jgi:hypothetical protein
MGKLKLVKSNWEHLYTQFKNPTGDPVICMVHKITKKFIYFDIKSKRVLSKQEALIFRPDVTGIHLISQ